MFPQHSKYSKVRSKKGLWQSSHLSGILFVETIPFQLFGVGTRSRAALDVSVSAVAEVPPEAAS